MRHIDPIVVRENQARMRTQHRLLADGEHAAAALLFFHDCCVGEEKDQKPKGNSINVTVGVVASAVVGAKEAQHYLKLAAEEMRATIVGRAIQMAQADHALGYQAAKKGKTT